MIFFLLLSKIFYNYTHNENNKKIWLPWTKIWICSLQFLTIFFSTACLMYSNNKFISYNIIDGASLCNALIVTLHNTISYNFSEIITRYSWFNIKYHSDWNNFLSFLELYHLILKIWIKSSLLTCTKLRMLDSLNWPVPETVVHVW